MHIVLVQAHVKPDAIEAFRLATIENARHSVQEQGIAHFDFIQQDDDPARFVLVEVYRDRQAPPRHRDTRHYAVWREAVEDMLVEPRTKVEYTNVFPGDADWG